MVLMIKKMNLIYKKKFKLINFEYVWEKFNERLTKFKGVVLIIKFEDGIKIDLYEIMVIIYDF